MKISDNFSSEEFDQPARHGLGHVPYPAEWIDERLRPLVAALEAIRAEVGKPITVLSGYRSPEYNAKVGGQPHSQHMQGRASDIHVEGMAPHDVHATILRLYNEGKIKIGGLGAYPGFTHVDVRPAGDHLAQWSGARTEN